MTASGGAAFQFTLDSAANLRQKDDSYNHAIAGFVSGTIVGLSSMLDPLLVTEAPI